MMIEYYMSLPDYLSVDELKVLFHRLLEEAMHPNTDLVDSLESLLELADRQWHTYELLSEDLKLEIEEWLLSIIDFKSDEVIEYLTLIVGRLGLSKLYFTLKSSLSDDLEKNIRLKIEEIVDEIDGHVEDPYYGMR